MATSHSAIRRFLKALFYAVLGGSLYAQTAQVARADTAGEKKRIILSDVVRVLVVPPFFGTETLHKGDRSDKEGPNKTEAAGDAHSTATPAEARLATYRTQLRSLEERVRARLPERIAARTDFDLVSADEFAAALKDLKMTPEQLFQHHGLIRGGRFADPDPQAVTRLASRCKADALFLATLDEPRRQDTRYFFDPVCGLMVDSAHVRCKAGFFVMRADGTQILHHYVETLHPLSRIGGREYLMADWMEVQDLAVEDFMDELTRYTRPKRTQAAPSQ